MNKQRKFQIMAVYDSLNKAGKELGNILSSEQDALDNYPENLQDTDRYAEGEDACDNLDDAIDHIDDAKSALENII